MLLLKTLAFANLCELMKNDSQIIDAFGGNEAVAAICEPTLPAVVSGWRTRGIPRAWLKVLMMHSPQHFEESKEDSMRGVA